MRKMLAPLMARLGERMARSPIGPLGRHVAASELGALLGYVAQRVLGQYDLLVPDGDAESGGGGAVHRDAVYYVGPNVLALEKRFAFRPRDFRTWIAVHEVTHRAQFTAVPWMRDHFLGLVGRSLELVDPDPRSLVRALRHAVEQLAAGRNPLDDGGLLGLFASAEQRELMSEVQALMSLLEGHGNYVMSELGGRHVHGEERMARVLQARRNRGGLSGQVQKALGLELKLRQYETGERFVRAVVAEAGPGALDEIWRSPSSLPTFAELDDPGAWAARCVRTRSAAGAR
ncbi:MAG: zinc-dependent metalloprotease [Acidimicrobiia bacterium]|nr:zinc-dependent metalloprotease [Acidimicrobiia bacterium]